MRVKAAVIDSILLIVTMYVISGVLATFENVPDSIRIVLFVCIFLLYDPLLTSMFGATIGHSFSKIVVKREADPSKNIPFFKAVPRFVVKVLLGWISLLTVTGHERKQALHDLVAGSVVLQESDEG